LGDDDDYLNLTVAEAREMSDADLKRLFVLITEDLRASFGDEALGPTFPRDPRSMTRIRILAALMEHAYWYDPHGGHPAPRMADAPSA
jgi:hypothetical protein